MSKNTDGGPAFPTDRRKAENYMDEGGYGRCRMITVNEGGMSLRDWFAGMALQGIVSNYVKRLDAGDSDADRWAEECYSIADSMLEERNKP